MAYIDIPDDLPGVRGLMAFRPELAGPQMQLAQALLHGESPLSRGDRELIAARISHLNECTYCHTAHSSFAAVHFDGGFDEVDPIITDPSTADISPKLRALLGIADLVYESGRAVTPDAITAARSEGATDVEIHDTVLIAAAFCMVNRYVDGLGTRPIEDRDEFFERARTVARDGYENLPMGAARPG